MSATVAATTSHYRYSDNPRTVRKPGGKHAGPLGVNASSAGVSATRSFLFGNALSPRKVHRHFDDDRRRTRTRRRPFCSVMEWQDCTVKMEVDIPASAKYHFYSDRESFPHWMPFISSVKRCIQFHCISYLMKIHSGCLFDGDIIRRASQGLEISFGVFKNQLTVSYEVPQLLVPVAFALQLVLEALLRRGLERFATLAKSKSS